MTGAPGENALDGIKIRERGRLYLSGPGGLRIISPTPVRLGTIKTPELRQTWPGGTPAAARAT